MSQNNVMSSELVQTPFINKMKENKNPVNPRTANPATPNPITVPPPKKLLMLVVTGVQLVLFLHLFWLLFSFHISS
jgi:hypothetical protein